MGGQLKRWAINFAGAFVVAIGISLYVQFTDFFQQPYLGPVWIAIIAAAAALVITELTTGLSNRKAFYSALTAVAITLVAWWPVQYLFAYIPAWWAVGLMGVVIVALSGVAAWLWGRRRPRRLDTRGRADGGRRGGPAVRRLRSRFMAVVPLAHRQPPDRHDRVADGGSGRVVDLAAVAGHLHAPAAADAHDHAHLARVLQPLFARRALLEVMQMDYVHGAGEGPQRLHRRLPPRVPQRAHHFRPPSSPSTSAAFTPAAPVITAGRRCSAG